MSSLVTSLLELLAPRRCLACRRRAPPPWCQACAARARPVRTACPRCAAPGGVAHRCWPADVPIAATTALFDYRDVVAAAVVTAKVAGARSGWHSLGRLLGERLAAAPPPVDVVTWVTTAPERVRQRGVDHARVLAEAVGAATGLPVLRLLAVRREVGGGERHVALGRLPGSEVLLVDDVLTTGRTALAAARALRAAGSGDVRLALLSRAGSHDLGGEVGSRAGRPTREGAHNG